MITLLIIGNIFFFSAFSILFSCTICQDSSKDRCNFFSKFVPSGPDAINDASDLQMPFIIVNTVLVMIWVLVIEIWIRVPFMIAAHRRKVAGLKKRKQVQHELTTLPEGI